jgi:hypothetical protein
MHNFTANLESIIEIAKEGFKDGIDEDGNFRFYPNIPKSSDIQIIALAILAEAQSMDSENLLFIKIKAEFPALYATLPHRTNYNRRKRRLQPYIDKLSEVIALKMTGDNEIRLVDSMPAPICRLARAGRCKIMRDDLEMLPAKGYQPIDKQYFFGYKLHVLGTTQGVINSFYLTAANVHDVKLLKGLTLPFAKDCTVIGDKGYINNELQLDLFRQANITVRTPARNNMRKREGWEKWMGRARKRIETVFSQQCDQFMFRRNYAKTFLGFFTRITTKIAAFTVLQYLNFIAGKPISQVKHTLFT